MEYNVLIYKNTLTDHRLINNYRLTDFSLNNVVESVITKENIKYPEIKISHGLIGDIYYNSGKEDFWICIETLD